MGLDIFDGFKMEMDLLWTMLTAEPLLTLGIIVFFGGFLIFALIVNVLREQKLRKSGILEVDKMSGRKFEEYLQALLKAKAMGVRHHQKTKRTFCPYGEYI
jgi:restriction system protein